uniref:Zn-finger protein n=1 Tax=Pithovirus LCPAC406 TaxID=2506599 RepID=A0A481ZCW9_9VIRU|nr:MAG: Zn-finger protein [Pithovirus LCPAC406]
MAYNLIKGSLEEEYLFKICRKISEYDGKPGVSRCDHTISRFIRNKLRISLKDLSNRSKDISFDIRASDLDEMFNSQGGVCKLSGIVLTTNVASDGDIQMEKRYVNNFTNVSIDRIDSMGSYTLDNIQLVCSVVNMMKLDMSQDLFLKFCKAIAQIHP